MSVLACKTLRQRVRMLLSVMIIAVVTCAPSQAAHPGYAALGDWKFTAVLDNVEITSIDDAQAQKLLGRVMSISKEGTRFGDEICNAPSFETERVETNLYVAREARISATNLRLPNPVTVIDVGCSRVFIKRPNHAVIFWDGFFFEAVKIKRSESRQQ